MSQFVSHGIIFYLVSFRNSSYTSGNSCSPAFWSPSSMAARIWVTSLMAGRFRFGCAI
jgi:hypothetical protein